MKTVSGLLVTAMGKDIYIYISSFSIYVPKLNFLPILDEYNFWQNTKHLETINLPCKEKGNICQFFYYQNLKWNDGQQISSWRVKKI